MKPALVSVRGGMWKKSWDFLVAVYLQIYTVHNYTQHQSMKGESHSDAMYVRQPQLLSKGWNTAAAIKSFVLFIGSASD